MWRFSQKDFYNQFPDFTKAVMQGSLPHGARDRKTAFSMCSLVGAKAAVCFNYDRFVARFGYLGWSDAVSNIPVEEMAADGVIRLRRLLYQVERNRRYFVSVPDSEDCLTLFLKQGLGYAAGLDEQARSRLVLRPDYRRSGTGKGAGGFRVK